MKNFLFFCWMVMASALFFTSCDKDYVGLEGEFTGNGGGGSTEPDDVNIKSVNKTSCNFVDVVFNADGAVSTRAAAVKDGTFIAESTHNLGVQVMFSDNSKKDTLLQYKTVAKANFFGLSKPRYVGNIDKVLDTKTSIMSKTSVGDLDGFKLDCQGRVITMLMEEVIVPENIKFTINGKKATYQGEFCFNEIVNLNYLGFEKTLDKEDGEFRGYNVILNFEVTLLDGKGNAQAKCYFFEAKNGIDPGIPDDNVEVVKITENASNMHSCVRDTTRAEGKFISNMKWDYSLHYLYSNGVEKDTIVKAETVAKLGLYNQELPAITVKAIEEYNPAQTSYRKGDIINNSQIIYLGIADIEKSMTSEWTTYTHVDGKIERPVMTFGNYVDYSFDKAGSFAKKVSDKEYVYYHRIVSAFNDQKLPQEAFWTRTVKISDQISFKDWEIISVKEVKSNNISHWEIVVEISYSEGSKVNRKIYVPTALKVIPESLITATQETEAVACVNKTPTGSTLAKLADFTQEADGIVGEKLGQNYVYDFTSFQNTMKIEYNGNFKLTIEGKTKNVPTPAISLVYGDYTQNKGVDEGKNTAFETKLHYEVMVKEQPTSIMSAQQPAKILVAKKDAITGYELLLENIVLNGNQFFRDLKFNELHSVDGNKEMLLNRNMNCFISDNGTIRVMSKIIGGVTIDGMTITNQTTPINDGGFTGFVTRSVQNSTVANQTATINVDIEGILSYQGVALGTYQPTIEVASALEFITTNYDGKYDITKYNIVYTISVDGKSITHRQSVEEWIVRPIDNTIPGYKVDPRYIGSFAWADLYNSGRTSAAGNAICGVFCKIDDDSKLILAAFDSNGAPMIQDGQPLRIAISNVPTTHSSLVWNGTVWEAGNLHGVPDLSEKNYRKGFEYTGLDNPALINFISPTSITVHDLPNPLKGVGVWESERGIVVINNIIFK